MSATFKKGLKGPISDSLAKNLSYPIQKSPILRGWGRIKNEMSPNDRSNRFPLF